MKKLFAVLSVSALGMTSYAQTEGYNKWSLDLNGGIVKPATPFAGGYYTERIAPLNAEAGIRYMFNNKFGLKLSGNYNKIESASNSRQFETILVGGTLQGVINLGRVLSFEDWTRCLNLQLHGGAGVSAAKYELPTRAYGPDLMITVPVGLTGQIKLAKWLALVGDFTMVNTALQNRSWDGSGPLNGSVRDLPQSRGFQGTYYTATAGLNIYFGSKGHADWAVTSGGVAKASNESLAALEQKIADLEAKLKDSDKDGVPDYLDAEPNTPANASVDSKGRSVDSNKNGVPDQIESYVTAKLDNVAATTVPSTTATTTTTTTTSGGVNVADLINGGYVNVYFDTSSATPTAYSTDAINMVVNYLVSNPSATVEAIGYADETGSAALNKKLSQKRAEYVKNTFAKAGIAANRVSVTAGGVDKTFNGKSTEGRKLSRRVTFKLK